MFNGYHYFCFFVCLQGQSDIIFSSKPQMFISDKMQYHLLPQMRNFEVQKCKHQKNHIVALMKPVFKQFLHPQIHK